MKGTKNENKVEVKEEPKKVYKMEFVKELDYIFILGRGPSLVHCPPKKPEKDSSGNEIKTEYWGCNNIYRARELDRLFIMHDVYITQFNREKNLIKDINQKKFPVYTLGQYTEIKNNILYPIEEVIKEFKIAHFLNNISYMLALAIMQKPKSLILFGADMSYGTNNDYMWNEKACMEFWLGMATGKGIKWQLAEGTTLMKRKGRDNFYGMVAKVDKPYNTLHLDPVYEWGKKKSALKYKLVKASHYL